MPTDQIRALGFEIVSYPPGWTEEQVDAAIQEIEAGIEAFNRLMREGALLGARRTE